MERMEGASRDEVSANVEALKRVFPAAVKEGKVDMEALKTLLGGEVAADTGCYRMTWNGKEAARQFALKRSRGTLLPDRGSSREWETTQNVYIEGDNLEVLKLLQGGYYNSVKMIYIDPPYNTGKDFVYHDNFHDSIENYKKLTGQVNAKGAKLKTNVETSGRYHTDWLNMMLPRLMLARNLLRDDGVIFISIDDNEVTNLRKICDEVFGEENRINGRCFISHIPNGTNKGYIARANEYILAYAKEITNLKYFYRLERDAENISVERCTNTPTEQNPQSDILFRKGLNFEGVSAKFTGTIGGEEPITIIGTMEFENGKLKNDVTLRSSWRNRAQVISCIEDGIAYDEMGQEVFEIFFSKEGKPKYKKRLTRFSPKSVQTFKSNASDDEFADLNFENPKPIALVEFLLRLCCEQNDLVVDFFSGSATTAHAVIKTNLELGLDLRTILVQLPENLDESINQVDGKSKTCVAKMIKYLAKKGKEHTLCEIGKERWYRAGDKVMAEWTARQNEAAGQLALGGAADATKRVPPDIGFRVFRLDTSNFADWNPNSEDLAGNLLKAKENVLVGRTKEDILYEVVVKCNFQLTDKITEHKVGNNTIYAVRNGDLMVCIDDQIPLEVGDEMLRLKHEVYGNPESFRAVFLDNGLSDDSKANIVQRLKGDGVDETCIRCV